MELAGEVAAVGAAVSEFQVGDPVFGVKGFGAHAEFTLHQGVVPLAHKPAGLSFEEAAAVCDGACSRCRASERPTSARAGASSSTARPARSEPRPCSSRRYFDADVTAVCNTKNVELVRSLGADEVIDYEQEDFTKNGETYDVIFDAVGKQSFRRCRGSLKPGGIYIATDGFRNIALGAVDLADRRQARALGIARYKKADVLFLKELIEAGKYRAVIDRTYPLEDVVEATRYVETAAEDRQRRPDRQRG